jgi:opacity protein-like surface antigen
MFRKVLLVFVVVLLFGSSTAWAQMGGFEFQEQSHKAEIGILGGYAWTVSRDFSSSSGRVNADIKSTGYYGVEADVNVRPGMQLVLLWTRQDTEFKLKGAGVPPNVPTSTPVNVEYWQIGALQGVQKGDVMPYGKFTLGGTRYAIDQPGISDEWQFSVILGIGAKMYPSDKIAIRLEGTMPWTFTSGGVGFGFGTGGAGLYVGGNGIAQFTVALGVNILLGSQ